MKFSASISAETLSCSSIWHVTEKILKNKSSDLYADNVFKDHSAVRLHRGLHVAASCCTGVAPVPVLSERKRSPVGFFSLREIAVLYLHLLKGAGLRGDAAITSKNPKNLKLS